MIWGILKFQLEFTIHESHLNPPKANLTITVCQYHVHTGTQICSLTRAIYEKYGIVRRLELRSRAHCFKTPPCLQM